MNCDCCGESITTSGGCTKCMSYTVCACGDRLLCLCGRKFEHKKCSQMAEIDFVAYAIADCDVPDHSTVYGADKLARVAIKAMREWREKPIPPVIDGKPGVLNTIYAAFLSNQEREKRLKDALAARGWDFIAYYTGPSIYDARVSFFTKRASAWQVSVKVPADTPRESLGEALIEALIEKIAVFE